MAQSLPPETLTGRIQLAFELAADRGAAQSQDADERALNALAQAAQLAGAAGVISDNDTLHEVSTHSLRVLLIPSLQAELEASARPTSAEDRSRQRRGHLQASIGAARNFATMLTRLHAMPPALLRVLQQRIVAAEAPEAARASLPPADQRKLKIQLFKLERAVRAHQDAFRTAYRERARARTAAVRAQASGTAQGAPADVRPIDDAFYDVLIVGEADDEDDADEDEDDGTEEALQGASGAMYEPRRPRTLRGYLLQLLVLHVVHTMGIVDSAAQELALLAMEPATSAPEPAPPADTTWRLDSGWFSGERGGPLLSEQGKPLRPFTITPSMAAGAPGETRRRMQGEVFRPSHRLPTMTIDEYLEEERRRGNIIDGGGPAQAAQATPKEQRAERAEMDGTREAEEAEEEARQEAMHWDEFRDSHRRGEGNRMNRG